MIILTDVTIKDFKNIKYTHLKDLNHVNIFIGPNNCGKSNLLKAISKLRLSEPRRDIKIQCNICNQIMNESNWFFNYACAKDGRDKYEGKLEPELLFSFNEEYVADSESYQKLLTYIDKESEKLENIISAMNLKVKPEHTSSKVDLLEHAKDWALKISLKGIKNQGAFRSAHGSVMDPTAFSDIKNGILECPALRTESYKGKNLVEYVKNKDLTDTELRNVQNCVKNTVDSKLVNYKSTSLNYIRGPNGFSAPLLEQGSGVKSVICLTSDIISTQKTKIILIDEPELGLNPAAKREFIEVLKRETTGTQVFIATHDPLFVNPKLWQDGGVSIYTFSIIKDQFVKIDLNKNAEDPNTFAGYLPHTTSLKDFHIYVEGMHDVYIHQTFFRNFLEANINRIKANNLSFFTILNRVAIYHLGGDFWSHLLHTLPKQPYKALLLFDGDKRTTVQEAVVSFNKNRLNNLPKLLLVEKLSSIVNTDENSIPVYCLSKTKMEKYLEPEPSVKSEGPEIAMKMQVPEEFALIYNAVLKAIYPQEWKNK